MPTLVVLTDRNDLDDQLFGQFQRCADILGQTPVQAASRDKLRELLAVASGGVVFTTIQKFLPEKGEKMPFLSIYDIQRAVADKATVPIYYESRIAQLQPASQRAGYFTPLRRLSTMDRSMTSIAVCRVG